MSIMSPADPSVWIRAPEAARILGMRSTRAVRTLAGRGLISVRSIPGTHPRYRREDLVKLAESSTRAR